MRIKSKDIARALNLSQATVSLVLNDRPGVNAQTRRAVLDYVEYLEEEKRRAHPAPHGGSDRGTVLVLNYIKHGVIMERDSSKSNSAFSEKLQKTVEAAGYQFWHVVFYEKAGRLSAFLEECQKRKVCGLYIMAAEMNKSDIYPFLRLKVPIVTGDNLFYEEGMDSYLVDNKEGIRRGVDYLVDKGHSHIVYLAEKIDIFNFEERREAFVEEMAKRDCGDASNRIRRLGSSLEEVYESMIRYLDEGVVKTTAFVLESGVISLGVSKALLEKHIRIPRDISLIGFDALPPVSLPGVNLTLIKGTHTKRHLEAVEHLLRHLESGEEETVRIYYRTRLLEGDSVFDKTKYIYHTFP